MGVHPVRHEELLPERYRKTVWNTIHTFIAFLLNLCCLYFLDSLRTILNIVGVFMMLAAQLVILFVYSPLDTIYSYASDPNVANLVFLDDYVKVPDHEAGGGGEVALL